MYKIPYSLKCAPKQVREFSSIFLFCEERLFLIIALTTSKTMNKPMFFERNPIDRCTPFGPNYHRLSIQDESALLATSIYAGRASDEEMSKGIISFAESIVRYSESKNVPYSEEKLVYVKDDITNEYTKEFFDKGTRTIIPLRTTCNGCHFCKCTFHYALKKMSLGDEERLICPECCAHLLGKISESTINDALEAVIEARSLSKE